MVFAETLLTVPCSTRTTSLICPTQAQPPQCITTLCPAIPLQALIPTAEARPHHCALALQPVCQLLVSSQQLNRQAREQQHGCQLRQLNVQQHHVQRLPFLQGYDGEGAGGMPTEGHL